MAIARTLRPRVLVFGAVEGVRDLRKKPENGGDIYAHEVTVKQPSGSILTYSVYVSSNAFPPSVGDFVAVECSIEESARFGASLSYEALAHNSLDLIASTLANA